MFRAIILFMLVASFATAQTKKPASAANNKALAAARAKAIQDSIRNDSIAAVEDMVIPKEFAVYTRRPRTKKDRMKLCINLVSPQNILNYCVNDSLCRDPEVTKLLFEKKQGDTTYALVYVRAFSKPDDKPSCDAGKERKLFFVRWNTNTNKAIVKLRNIESCMKNITNMSQDAVENWDGTSPLICKYYRGGQNFVEVKFDPQNYLMGFQSSSDN